MSVFQHPYLTRGIVQTEKGAFTVSRGRVEIPDELGESLGWQPVDRADDQPAGGAVVHPKASARAAVTTLPDSSRRP
jgi:hypothetical protein